jgi:hypothetical protein
MAFRNLPLVLSACSLVLGSLLFALAFTASPPGDSALAVNHAAAAEGPVFAVLELDELVPDRETAAALNQALNLEAAGREVLSESSQWVLLNDFDKIIRVPLDRYEERLEAFDPRNDGFAGRLRSFFVRNGKRYFFIPLDDSAFRAGGIFRPAVYRSLEKTIRGLLGETAYTLSFPGEASFLAGAAPFKNAGGHGGLYGLYLLCYLLAALGLCFLFRPRLLAFHLVLPLAGLSLLGSPGFAMGAILCLLAGLLLDPMREFCFSLHRAGSFRWRERGFLANIRWNGLVPYRSRWLFSFLLIGLYILSAVLGEAGPLLGAGSFVVFMGIFFAYFMTKAGGREGHRLFVPVIIIKNRASPEFPRTILPFACASLVSAFLTFSSLNVDFDPPRILAWLDEVGRPAWPGPEMEEQQTGDWPPPISAEEYRAHVLFQTGFSLLPLGSGFTQPEYFRYDIGQDGLIADVSAEFYGAELYGMEDNIPPFLLEGFMTFLEQQVYTGAARNAGSSLTGFLPALCTLVICIPAFTGSVRRGGGRRKPSLCNDKRIAA